MLISIAESVKVRNS